MGATPASHVSVRRYRRRVVGWGAAALAVVFATGAAVALGRVEDDLESRSAAAVEALGVDGVTVSFSGQDGALSCSSGLADPDVVVDEVGSLRGVREIVLDESCTQPVAPEPVEVADAIPPETTTTAPPVTTVATTTTEAPPPDDLLTTLESDPRFSVLTGAIRSEGLDDVVAGNEPVTVFAPTDDAFAALGPNLNAALIEAEVLGEVVLQHVVPGAFGSDELRDGPLDTLGGGSVDVDTSVGTRVTAGSESAFVVEADLESDDGGAIHVVDRVLVPDDLAVAPIADEFTLVARYDEDGILLAGAVATSASRDQLVEVARSRIAPANVDDRLEVDAEDGASEAEVDAAADLLAIVPTTLARGEVLVAIDGVFVSGVTVGADARGAVRAVAADVGAVAGVGDRNDATDETAAALEQRMNDVVAAEPITFQPGTADLADGAGETIDRLAALAKSLAGVRVTVIGHTDSAGDDDVNLALSEQRAAAVAFVLGARGVPPDDLAIVGRGSNDPVVVDGVEDAEASRRVEFTVVRR